MAASGVADEASSGGRDRGGDRRRRETAGSADRLRSQSTVLLVVLLAFFVGLTWTVFDNRQTAGQAAESLARSQLALDRLEEVVAQNEDTLVAIERETRERDAQICASQQTVVEGVRGLVLAVEVARTETLIAAAVDPDPVRAEAYRRSSYEAVAAEIEAKLPSITCTAEGPEPPPSQGG